MVHPVQNSLLQGLDDGRIDRGEGRPEVIASNVQDFLRPSGRRAHLPSCRAHTERNATHRVLHARRYRLGDSGRVHFEFFVLVARDLERPLCISAFWIYDDASDARTIYELDPRACPRVVRPDGPIGLSELPGSNMDPGVDASPAGICIMGLCDYGQKSPKCYIC